MLLQWNLPERPPLLSDHLTKIPIGSSGSQIAISETSHKVLTGGSTVVSSYCLLVRRLLLPYTRCTQKARVRLQHEPLL